MKAEASTAESYWPVISCVNLEVVSMGCLWLESSATSRAAQALSAGSSKPLFPALCKYLT